MLLNIILSSEILYTGKYSPTHFIVTFALIICCIGTPPWLIVVCVVVGLIIIAAGVFTVSIIWYKVKNKGTSLNNNNLTISTLFEGAG